MTTIELNNEEAELFKLFRQYQDDFQLLVKRKERLPNIFELKNGQAIIHKDSAGKIGDIDIVCKIHKRGK